MSISLAALPPEIILALVLFVVAAAVARLAGVFRADGILGPLRLSDDVSTWQFILVTGICVGIWFGVQVVYGFVIAIFYIKKHPGEAFDFVLSPGDYAILSTIPPALGFAITLFSEKFIRGNVLERIGFTARRFLPGLCRGIVGALIVIPMMFVASITLELIYRALSYEHPSEHDLLHAMKTAGPITKWTLIFGAVIAAPVFEEYFFRGHLQTLLAKMFTPRKPRVPSPPLVPIDPMAPEATPVIPYEAPPPPPRKPWLAWMPVIITSILFASVHPLWMAPLIFVLSLGLGYSYERTGNLWVPMTIHAAFNTASTVYFLLGGKQLAQMRLAAELESRGLLYQATDPQMDAKLTQLSSRGPVVAYAGFDPTADSLHVGNFVPILGLMRAQREGITPIAVVGGATALIGDPSGKANERQLLTKETVSKNADGIRRVLERFLDFKHPTTAAKLVNNLDWLGPMSAVDFLRNVGKHFRIGQMLAKDSVRGRMEGNDEGMSYTEFSYQLLQGYDFYRLYKDHRCILQLGGSDQWGNITAGTDLIRKLEGEGGHTFGITMPLITTSSGTKFGKTEAGAVWLTADRTSVFDFYQFWLRTEDADVEKYLKTFTFIPLDQIATVMSGQQKSPEKRAAQRRLADEVTTLVHGADETSRARAASETLYSGGAKEFNEETIAALAAEVPTTNIDRAKLEAGWPLIDAIVETGLAKSKSDARRLIGQGGMYVNNVAITDVNAKLVISHLATPSALVLRSGKKRIAS